MTDDGPVYHAMCPPLSKSPEFRTHSAWSESRPKKCSFWHFWSKIAQSHVQNAPNILRAFIYLPHVYKSWKFRTNTLKGFCDRELQSGRNFENLFWLPKKFGGWGGLTLPHRRVGLLPRYFVCMEPPYTSLPRFFVNFLKMSKIWPFFEGYSSAPGSKFEKMGQGFFVLNPQKIFCDILTRATLSKPRVQVPTPQNFLKQCRILGGAPVGGSLVGFGSKVAPVGTPNGKVNLASPTP